MKMVFAKMFVGMKVTAVSLEVLIINAPTKLWNQFEIFMQFNKPTSINVSRSRKVKKTGNQFGMANRTVRVTSTVHNEFIGQPLLV